MQGIIILYMKVYHYSRDKFNKYMGFSEARLDPMVHGRFVCPAYATFEKPPFVDKKTEYLYFDVANKKWDVKQIPKHRFKDNSNDGTEKHINTNNKYHIRRNQRNRIRSPNPYIIQASAPASASTVRSTPPAPRIRQAEKDYVTAMIGLTRSDWTQLTDVNLTQESKFEWLQFRRELREILFKCKPVNGVFPEIKEVALFPKKPKSVWL
jgi:hypothetical protein